MTPKYIWPSCGRRPATDYGSKQESVDDSNKQNNGKRGCLSLSHPLYHYKVR